MSSQVPRLSDNRLHPYSQLSQSPVSPTLVAKDSRPGAGSSRLAIKARFDQSLQSQKKQLSSPVIHPQRDWSSTDDVPSPLLLPAQYAVTPSAQPLKKLHVNRLHPKSTTKEKGIDLAGLTDKLGFHEPSRETITPRGSDDEGEDLLMLPSAGRVGRRSNTRTYTRNSRSLCIEDKARRKRKQQQGESPSQVTQRKALSEQPCKSSGVASPSERRGRSRDVKPCSESLESTAGLPASQATIETNHNISPGLDEFDAGEFETATVEKMLAGGQSAHLSDGLQPVNDARSALRPVLTYFQRTSQMSHGSGESSHSRSPDPIATQADRSSTDKNAEPGHPQSIKNKAKSSKSSTTTSNPTLSTLTRPRPFTALSEKSCATVVKQATNVFAPPSPANSVLELTDGEESAISSVNSLQLPRRSASISLKRIQDQDLVNILGSSAIRIPSPITSPRMSISEEAPVDPPYTINEEVVQVTVEPATSPPRNGGPLHRLRDVLPIHKGALPKARALLKIAAPGNPRSHRSVSHQVLPQQVESHDSVNASGSLGRSILKRSRTASTATDGGDQKRVYTRWDGVQTPITKEDHPVHWEILQTREQLRKEASKQSASHGFPTQPRSPVLHSEGKQPSPSGNIESVLPSRVVSLTHLAHHAVTGLARPVSHRHKSAPLRVPSYKPTGTVHQNLFDVELRPSFSQESLAAPSHDSLASSFDSKVAYKACRKEEGYVDFDKVLGLSNHASREGISAMVGESST
ncbi:hypothetical protein NCC49_003391 [Naganishia albida]|nr:hypothetical protein NCC49_003391 [Naganishia albida]